MSFRWPWSPRWVVDQLREQLSIERNEVKRLTEVITEMKMAGGIFVPVDRQRATVMKAKAAKPVRSAIDQAIDENRFASSDPRLRRYLQQYGMRELERGIDEKVITAKIRAWSVLKQELDDDDDEDDDLIDLGADHAANGATAGDEDFVEQQRLRPALRRSMNGRAKT